MTMRTVDGRPNVSIDGDSFRAVMSTFCSGVVVVTAMEPATADAETPGQDRPVGMTAQSFLSLSLDPPFVLICPSTTSVTWPRIESVGRFAINVLRDGQSEVSDRFATRGRDKFSGQSWVAGEFGAPLLEGALSHIECDLEETYAGGDHVVVIGRVRATHVADDVGSAPPLVYYRSRYQSLVPSSS